MNFLKKYKKIFSLLIIAVGIVGAFLVVKLGGEPSYDYLFEVVPNESSLKESVSKLPELPNLTSEFTNQSLQKLIAKEGNVVARETNYVENVQTLPDKTDVQKIVDEIIEKEFSQEKIDVNSIPRTQNESRETQVVYLLVIKQIVSDISEKNNLENIEGIPISKYFENIAKNYNNTVDILRAMNVPNPWADIHAKLLGFFLSQKNIYTSLSLADQDPLRFMIAIQRVAEDSEGRFDAIRIEIEKRMKEQKII